MTPMPIDTSTPLPPSPDLGSPLTALFDEASRLAPDRVFIHSRSLPSESRTFAAFAEEARAVARHLVAAGVTIGDRVAILSENRPRWCVAYAAILYAGGIVVPIDAQALAEAVANILSDSGARLAFVSGGLRATFDEAARGGDCRAVPFDGNTDPGPWADVVALAPAAALPVVAGADAPAAIIYTSGTTGTPKGVVLTHGNIQAEVRAVGLAVAFAPDDVLIMFLPLQHVFTQVGGFLLPAALRTRAVHAVVQRGEDLLEAVREEGVTVLLAVPLLYHLIHERIMRTIAGKPWIVRGVFGRLMAFNRVLRARLSVNAGRVFFRPVHAAFGPRLRLMVSGGAALDPEVQRDFVSLGFPITQAYGLTETAGGATFTPMDDVVVGTVGRPLPGVSVRISRPDADGVGEICLAGPIITPGYHGRPDDTAAILRDGWLLTGDLGLIDGRGNLRITGRKKDVIVLGSGKNVYPEEVEAHYGRCAHVKEICVVSRRREGGPDRTEKLHAVVVPDWDRLRAEGVASVHDRIRYEIESASLQLPSYQRVLSFELRREPLPRTGTRKVQRFLVVPAGDLDEGAGTAAPDAPEAAARLESEAGRLIADLVRQRAGAGSAVLARSSLELDLGLDSLNRMELLLSVEAALGVAFDDEEAVRIATVDELVTLALAKGAGGGRAGDEGSAAWGALVAAAGPADLPPMLRRSRGFVRWPITMATILGARLASRIVFRLETRGLENLPQSAPYLICPNHVSWLDGFVIAATFPSPVVRDAFVLAEADYVNLPIAAALSRFFGLVPVDPNRHLRQAMRIGAAGLKQGRILWLFPEGTRSPDGTLKDLRLGAAILATELRVPIVPVVIEGSFEAWPRGQSYPKPHPIRVAYGAPIRPEAVHRGASDPSERYRRVNDALRDGLRALGAPMPRQD